MLVLGVALLLVASALVAGGISGSARAPVPASSHLGVQVKSPQYNVTFIETGLPSGTNWTPVLAGTHHPTTQPTLTVLEGNGTYNWSVLSVASPMADGAAGWAPNASGGVIKVVGAPLNITVTFLPGYNVTIKELGLPTGTNWSVALNGTTRHSNNSFLIYILVNATYSFAVTTPLAGPPGVQYVGSSASFGVTLKGVNLSRTDTFTTQFLLTTSGNPAAGGSVSPATAFLNNRSTTTLGETPASGYLFIGWQGTGTGNYTGTTPAPTITMLGPISEVAEFSAMYTVTFQESGLPSGTSWSLTFQGTPSSTTGSSFSFVVPNGTYAYLVGPVGGYSASPSGGNAVVLGASLLVPITWSPFQYAVTFTESGLASGTSWTVTFNGVPSSSTSATQVFPAANGTWGYVIGAVPGYQTSSPTSGSVSVAGANVTVSTVWTVFSYTVSFTEQGLPSGTNWSVTLAGSHAYATGALITFQMPNGSFAFQVGGVAGYAATPGSGSLTVAGAAVSQNIVWTETTYAVQFTETGLAPQAVWSVTLAGTAQASTSSTIVFSEPNGTFAFVAGAVAGFLATPTSGSVQVTGSTVDQTIAYQELFAIVLTETGLPAGTNWSVTLGSSEVATTTSSITFHVTNGSYPYVVTNLSGYTVSPDAATLHIQGAGQSVSVQFSTPSSSAGSLLGLSTLDWGLIVVVLLLILLLAALLLRRRRGPSSKPSPEPPEPHQP